MGERTVDDLEKEVLGLALRKLVAASHLVVVNLCDQDTGWYYEFIRAIEQGERALLKGER